MARSITFLLLVTHLIFACELYSQVEPVASALLCEGETLPGDELGGTITGINNSATNGVGGFAFTVTTDGSISHVWGSTDGSEPTVIRTEGVVGDLDLTSFESFFGLSDTARFGVNAIGYSASNDDLIQGGTGLDGAFIDDEVLRNEEQEIPLLSDLFSTFNSRVGVTAAGDPYWIGGLADTPDGGTQLRALFFGELAMPFLVGGDNVGGVGVPLGLGGSLDFDVRFSDCGSNYILQGTLDSGSAADDGVVIVNGDA